jgi:hypothetical protein
MSGAGDLEAQLGAAPPPGLVKALSDDDLAHLAQTVRETRREESRALAEAGESALRFIPALLRGPVKKIVGLR